MGYQEIKKEGKRCNLDLRGEERKETLGTYSDSSFKVVLVHPDSSASHSSLKKKQPADSTHHLHFFVHQGMFFIEVEFKPFVTEFSGISRHLT